MLLHVSYMLSYMRTLPYRVAWISKSLSLVYLLATGSWIRRDMSTDLSTLRVLTKIGAPKSRRFWDPIQQLRFWYGEPEQSSIPSPNRTLWVGLKAHKQGASLPKSDPAPLCNVWLSSFREPQNGWFSGFPLQPHKRISAPPPPPLPPGLPSFFDPAFLIQPLVE